MPHIFDIPSIRTKRIRVTPQHPAVEIKVVGDRDPRGADNNIYIWLDTDDDTLHIRVEKPNRCYRFAKVIDEGGYIEVIQE